MCVYSLPVVGRSLSYFSFLPSLLACFVCIPSCSPFFPLPLSLSLSLSSFFVLSSGVSLKGTSVSRFVHFSIDRTQVHRVHLFDRSRESGVCSLIRVLCMLLLLFLSPSLPPSPLSLSPSLLLLSFISIHFVTICQNSPN